MQIPHWEESMTIKIHGREYELTNKRLTSISKKMEKVRGGKDASVCWVCEGARYPGWNHNIGLHQLVYMLFNDEEIKPKEEIHHICRNPRCVNPLHLIKCSSRYVHTLTAQFLPKGGYIQNGELSFH